ncbi:MAG TPA: GNAT family N-acetyltransferase [Acidimicrobiales bacterium]|nr:GNAT family N-acetyltransferase [Acidimicrobiales bacterium]
MNPPVRRVDDPDELAELYGRHREVHPYGLADLEEPLWGRSTWFRAGDAAVGVLDLGAGEPVLYAVAADADGDAATLDLLDALAPDLPDHFVITGPVGVAERLAPGFEAEWVIPHVKMHLPDARRLPPADERVAWLDRAAEARVVELRSHGEDASAFFVASLLDTGWYAGIPDDGDGLAAVAGVHVISERHGVAAIGNVLTHPAHRRRGLARALMATLGRRLLDAVPTVGLNVGTANTGARRLYEDLGFVPLVTYEEAELRRPQ